MTKKVDEIDLHSKEVDDLLGRVPSWIIRNGMVMVVVVLFILISGSWFFKYPDIIAAPVVVAVDVNDSTVITGLVKLKQNIEGKVKVGQRVNLKFVNYPYLEYGMVKGIVSKISLMPTGDYYALEVGLPEMLVSTYGKKFEFGQELNGIAEIITDDQSLLERILHPVRNVLKPNH
jgi:HlyD family secretion protein